MREIEPGIFVARSVARAKGRARFVEDMVVYTVIITTIISLDTAINGTPIWLALIEKWLFA